MSSDESFRKREHLLKSKDFRNVYSKGTRFKKEGIFLYCLPSGRDYNRVGFSISSKNTKLATRRNRIRRLFRESYRRNKRNFKKGFDLVLVVRKDTAAPAISYEYIERILLWLADSAGILTCAS